MRLTGYGLEGTSFQTKKNLVAWFIESWVLFWRCPGTGKSKSNFEGLKVSGVVSGDLNRLNIGKYT